MVTLNFIQKKFILILVFYGLYVIGFFSYRKFNFDANVHFFYFLVFFFIREKREGTLNSNVERKSGR
jgi:hypothetical protein